jgi:hypothetical protein
MEQVVEIGTQVRYPTNTARQLPLSHRAVGNCYGLYKNGVSVQHTDLRKPPLRTEAARGKKFWREIGEGPNEEAEKTTPLISGSL